MTAHVLILCTHNSARSILAEGMLGYWARRLGRDVRAHSAGSAPSGRVNPLALSALEQAGVDTTGFHSKSWDAYTGDDAPRMRVVITVCDAAAGEACPIWPANPVRVHWGYPDPSNTPGGDEARAQAFELIRQAIGYRMLQLLALPLEALSDDELRSAVTAIAEA